MSSSTLAPSDNEIRLGRRVLELEKERNTQAAELAALKARYQDHSTTIPVPTTTTGPLQITIPNELLPTLSLLRNHIYHLTRDNEALRNTFIGNPSPSTTADSKNPDTTTKPIESIKGHGLDLEAVLGRVKELIKENEELGEMVIELGRSSTEEWEKALEESKSVITSLDADLSHHLALVQSLRSDLDIYQNHYGPLSSISTIPESVEPTVKDSSANRIENAPKSGSLARRDSRRRDGHSYHRDRDRTKERKDGDHRSNTGGHANQGREDRSHPGKVKNDFGPGRNEERSKDDDRTWKRRR